MKQSLLVVDDDPGLATLVASILEAAAYEVHTAVSGREAMQFLSEHSVDACILDFALPDIPGDELFDRVRSRHAGLPVLFLTGHPNLEQAVALMKDGARDYLTKPFDPAELVERVEMALRPAQAANQAPTPRLENLGSSGWVPGTFLLGQSPVMRALDEQIRHLPRYPLTTVLLTGPTGTGKSLLARCIHELTNGDQAPFVEIDCSTIPRELCESELFGHEKGAFTGAHRAKPGLFEAAGNGTAFLDEIGDLDYPLQAKLLRVLEARSFKRVGGEASLPMRARVIAATNRSLGDMVAERRFREDLYFRLNVIELRMPALKERGDDIFLLAQGFLEHFARSCGKPAMEFSPQALAFIRNYDFPGNIRELRNLIERAVICAQGGPIEFPATTPSARLAPDEKLRLRGAIAAPCPESQPVPLVARPASGGARAVLDAGDSCLNLADSEREILRRALAAVGGNKTRAANLVGLNRTSFFRRLQKHGLLKSTAEPSSEIPRLSG